MPTEPAPRPTALITGASSGLGVDYAKIFAREGYDLVIAARSTDKLQALAQEIRAAHGVEVRVETVDLSDPSGPEALFARLDGVGMEIDVLVNNAGLGLVGGFVEHELPRQMQMVHVNVVALTALTHLFVRPMVARGHGRILNVASLAAFTPGPRMAVYFATKAYVVSFSEGLAHELRGSGVSVTAHCPGATETGFAKEAGAEESLMFRAITANSEDVAKHGYRLMVRRRVVGIHGWFNRIMYFTSRISPRAIVRWVSARMVS